MEESNAMTIEFLRARLLSERTVSRSAKQRADELAKRVAELEEQLKSVSLQRKKAEKATADVLAILENHGISDLSEDFDTCSDHDGSLHDFNVHNGLPMAIATPTDMTPRKNEMEASSSSEIEFSASMGKSLSWRSTKDSQNPLEKKYIDSVRRRPSFASNSLSSRKIGKSCRRIRHRETRSTQESKNHCTKEAECSVDTSNGSSNELVVALKESPEYDNEKKWVESAKLGSKSESLKMRGLYFNGGGEDEDMESALQHQAQLIGRYEEEEKAQREWEEKFRENNSATQDSGDPGTHSDVTEERYEMKSPEPSSRPSDTLHLAGNNNNNNNNNNSNSNKEPNPDSVTNEPPTSKNLPNESSALEFSFPASNEEIKIDKKDFPRKKHEASENSFQHHPSVAQMAALDSNNLSPQLELAVLPQGQTSNNLGSVLGALQQAKLSLTKRLNHSTAPPAEPPLDPLKNNKSDTSFQLPFATTGLFRLPTDYQSERDVIPWPSFPNYLSNDPFLDSRSGFSGDLFLTNPFRPFSQEVTQPSLSELPQSSLSNRTSHLGSYTNPVLSSFVDYSYPFVQDVMLRVPLNEQGSGSSERGLSSVMQLSPYGQHFRPNMYR